MQLVLAVPAAWPVRAVGGAGGRVVTAPGGAMVEIGPLVPLPDDPRAFVAAVMARDVPAAASVKLVSESEARSTIGWPMRIIEAQVKSGATVEHRIGGFYELHEWAGQVLVRIPGDTDMAVARPEIVQLLATGRPTWRSREVIAAIAELWS